MFTKTQIENACKGKSKSAGGLNIPDLKQLAADLKLSRTGTRAQLQTRICSKLLTSKAKIVPKPVTRAMPVKPVKHVKPVKLAKPAPVKCPSAGLTKYRVGQELSGSIGKEAAKIVKLLGSGSFGNSYLIEYTNVTGKTVPAVMKQSCVNESSRTEVNFLRHLSTTGVTPKLFTEMAITQGQLSIIMEAVDGETLESWAQKHPSLPKIIDVANQIVAAFNKIHRLGIAHRDIKPENLMITNKKPRKVVVIDLGSLCEPSKENRTYYCGSNFMTKRFGHTQLIDSKRHQDACGTVGFNRYTDKQAAQCLQVNIEMDHWSMAATIIDLYLVATKQGRITDPRKDIDKLPRELKVIVAPLIK